MQVTEEVHPPVERVHRLFWWKEALIAAVFYAIYSWTRNQFGSNEIAADGVPEQAFTNAERVIRFEEWLGLYHELTVQEWFLPYRWFIQFWNVYYGTAHFFVTLGVFILLYVKRADVFPMWRNTLAAMTALAIIGFAFFPLMPPRLLDEPCPRDDPTEYGGACLHPFSEFGYVDTLAEYGGPWSFDSETVASISNQYAAMPSLHIGWATWCAIAIWPLLRRRWTKALALLYPAATLFAIVVTANHYWIDGVGGLLVFGLGALIGWVIHRWNQDRLDRKAVREATPVGIDRPPAAAVDAHAGSAPVTSAIDEPMPAGSAPVTVTDESIPTEGGHGGERRAVDPPTADTASTADAD